jgi:multidrug efflux pump
MLGETTLAMLYVPFFFYLFDTVVERAAKKREAKSPPEPSSAAPPGDRGPERPTPATEGGQ